MTILGGVMSAYSGFREEWAREDLLPEEPWWVVLGCERDVPRREARRAFDRMWGVIHKDGWGAARTPVKRLYLAWDQFLRERSTVKEPKKKPGRDERLNEKRLIF